MCKEREMNNEKIDEIIGFAFIFVFLGLAIIGLLTKKDYKVEHTNDTKQCIEYDNGILDGEIEFIDLNPHWVSKSILPKCKKWEEKN